MSLASHEHHHMSTLSTTPTTTITSNNNGKSIQNENQRPQQQQQEPCFSFKKQPIITKQCHSAISSFIEPVHSLNKSLDNTSLTNSNKSPKKLSMDEIAQLDYDDQIRAPRMSTLSKTNSIVRILEHEPLGDCDFMHRNSNDSTLSNDEFSNTSRNTSATSNNSMGLPTLLTNPNTTLVEQTKHYCPATYDLNRTLRRFSTPTVSNNNSNNNNNNNKNHYHTNQLTYAEIAKKALDNFQHNMTSYETNGSKDPRERINTNGPIRQIDEPKTPNYIPAVLRPPNYQSSHNVYHTRKTSFSSLAERSSDGGYNSRSSSPTGNNKPRTSSSSSTSLNNKFMELPKTHWVPNNERSNCSMCDSKFSIINRKHHCRKCGDIFCMNCCYIRASLNFKLNFDLVNGLLVKVCNNCAIDYNQYIRLNFSHGGPLENETTTDLSNKIQANDLSEKERQNQSLVPIDWNWSSF